MNAGITFRGGVVDVLTRDATATVNLSIDLTSYGNELTAAATVRLSAAEAREIAGALNSAADELEPRGIAA